MAFPMGESSKIRTKFRSGGQIKSLTARIPSEGSLRLEGREQAREGESDDEVFEEEQRQRWRMLETGRKSGLTEEPSDGGGVRHTNISHVKGEG